MTTTVPNQQAGQHTYALLGPDGQPYDSATPSLLGGHRRGRPAAGPPLCLRADNGGQVRLD